MVLQLLFIFCLIINLVTPPMLLYFAYVSWKNYKSIGLAACITLLAIIGAMETATSLTERIYIKDTLRN
jgi:hypothetical protein